jgi:dihydrolipoamide dehydrogenase
MSHDPHDLVILGGGPAGYVAAIRAAQLGLRACVVEKDRLGGVCLNLGCIPSKALIHQADLFASGAALEELGLAVDRSGFSYRKVFERSRQVADRMSAGVQYLLRKNRVEVVRGTGSLVDRNAVALQDGTRIEGRHILLATGSRPRQLPGFPFDGRTVVSSDDALMATALPRSILILGAGAIGCELAHVLAAFGCAVTLAEMQPQLLPLEDEESAAVVERSFRRRGIAVLTRARAVAMERLETGARVRLEVGDKGPQNVVADQVLVVVGRVPNTAGIGLERVGIEPVRGFIPVGDHYQTSVPGIYAAGDVIDTPLLAHLASKEAEVAVEHMAGRPAAARVDPSTVPAAVFCEPQVASFGLTEGRARADGIPFDKAVFPFRAVGKAVAVGKDEGHVKVLVDPRTREILGAHVVGEGAPELIHELLLARSAELLPEDVARLIHAHPTLSEAVMEAMRGVEGWAIHF